jgi:hypothetical protein
MLRGDSLEQLHCTFRGGAARATSARTPGARASISLCESVIWESPRSRAIALCVSGNFVLRNHRKVRSTRPRCSFWRALLLLQLGDVGEPSNGRGE